MVEYRAYIMSHDDHILRPVELVCEDDEAAKEKARQLVDGYGIELWSGERFITRIDHKKTKPE
jgi:hypothetical protein